MDGNFIQNIMLQVVAYQQSAAFSVWDLLWLASIAGLIFLLTKVAVKVIRLLLVVGIAVLAAGFLFSIGLLPMGWLGA